MQQPHDEGQDSAAANCAATTASDGDVLVFDLDDTSAWIKSDTTAADVL